MRPACVVRRMSTLENNYSNIVLCKTTGSTFYKFHMEHDLTPGSQNCEIGSGRISEMATVTKNSKNNKINLFSGRNNWNFLDEFWHGISREHTYYSLPPPPHTHTILPSKETLFFLIAVCLSVSNRARSVTETTEDISTELGTICKAPSDDVRTIRTITLSSF